jgi:uncharacterized protein YceK
MESAVRILITLALVAAIGLSACGRRGSLDRPKPSYPETTANPATKMSKAPDRRIPILDSLIE